MCQCTRSVCQSAVWILYALWYYLLGLETELLDEALYWLSEAFELHSLAGILLLEEISFQTRFLFGTPGLL